MPEPLTGYIDAWRQNIKDIGSHCWQLGNSLGGAAIWVGVQNWPYAKMYLESAADEAHIMAHLLWFEENTVYENMYGAMHYVDENMGGDVTLDMDAILTAIWDTDKLRSFQFINYIDAMRASIWNTEIYETHLQDWYRHFST